MQGTASPVIAQRLLGDILREHRKAAGRTAGDVAAALGWSQSTVTRLETAPQIPKPHAVRALLTELGITGADQTHALALVEAARRRGWWEAHRDSVSDEFRAYLGLEDAADLIHTMEPDTIPGLLQTEEYTRALIAARHPDLGEATVEDLVAVRSSRQRRLGDVPDRARLWVVLGQAALLYQVGGRQVMAAQLRHLLTMADTGRAAISIWPYERGPLPVKGPFTILTFAGQIPETVYLETAGQDQWVKDAEQVGQFIGVFEAMLVAGADYDQTRALIRDAAARLG